MIGAHVQGVDWGGAFGLKFPLDPATPISFTRPVYPYPLHAKYKGAGDPNDAGNFEPAEPTDTSSAVRK
jgi:feruloyl esterase